MASSKKVRRRRIQNRIRNKISGTGDIPRLTVYRSNKRIYCQVVNDELGRTLVQCNSLEKDAVTEGSRTDHAKKVGQVLAERCKSLSISKVVFDRSGFLYHGRVKALADGAREGGLIF